MTNSKKIIGRKVGMIQTFAENGSRIPTTVVEVLPNTVLEVKTAAQHGYTAVKVGVFTTLAKKLNQPQKKYFEKLNLGYFKLTKELRNMTGYEVGQTVQLDIFEPGEKIDVQAVSKGKGYTGAIKRWNFRISPMSHGSGYPHRYQGTISFGRGGSQGQRVFKGKKMAGHHGHKLTTVANLTVLKIDLDKNLLLVKGSIPGPKNATVMIKNSVKSKSQPKSAA